ncbi:protein kinase C-binding protein NELL2-like isoform X2 [Hydractinia symbiolongicarpus]|uniref:protein kinase C-binding protein NELL2-like isoform X2 n=1 Tax=Hydractinia symbiolongicarpus TaxID=13093 RepID=UPI00254EFA67|nr:protein kinase C-binding protein NELL2-like isoform X2 [Hydractinia symbiolongicarpus]
MCFLSDIDECARNMHNCHTDATCQNLIGLFNCFCKVGLEGNGTHCKDITECSSNIHNCSQVATCYEMYASYSCVCHTGYTGDGFSCYGNKVIPVKFISQLFGTFILPGFYLDVNECSEETDNCYNNATCRNLIGSFNCTCDDGFMGNGTFCDGMHAARTETLL